MSLAGSFGWMRWPGSSARVAFVLLVAANLIPLVGVLFFDWDVRTILVMYWLENGIVGALNVVRILAARGSGGSFKQGPKSRAGMAAFFSLHYGLFWVVHGGLRDARDEPRGVLSVRLSDAT